MNIRIWIALAAIALGCLAIRPLILRRQFRAESEFRKGFKTKVMMESMVWLVYERRDELKDFWGVSDGIEHLLRLSDFQNARMLPSGMIRLQGKVLDGWESPYVLKRDPADPLWV